MTTPASARPPLTDSPWFWLYVFATAGVLALMWMGPKFGARQSQLDRQFEGRRHITQLPADTPGQRPYSSAEARELSLRPLYAILTVAVLGGWLVLWWQRFRSASAERPQASDHDSAADPESDAKQPESKPVAKPEAESQSDPVGGSPEKESVR